MTPPPNRRPGRGGSGNDRGSRGAPDPARAFDPTRIVYGRHPVREALRGQREVLRVHHTEAAARDVADVLDAAGQAGIEVLVSGGFALAELAGTEDHQGLLAEVGPFPYRTVDELVASAEEPLLFCLDQVTDPRNLGAIARVCDAAGGTGLVIPEHRSAEVTAAAVKASAGALEHVMVARCRNLADAIADMKSASMWVYGTAADGDLQYDSVDAAGGIAFVLGAEGAGMRPRVRAACDGLVALPMQGSVSSLNVATVAAVLAFEVGRRRAAR